MPPVCCIGPLVVAMASAAGPQHHVPLLREHERVRRPQARRDRCWAREIRAEVSLVVRGERKGACSGTNRETNSSTPTEFLEGSTAYVAIDVAHLVLRGQAHDEHDERERAAAAPEQPLAGLEHMRWPTPQTGSKTTVGLAMDGSV